MKRSSRGTKLAERPLCSLPIADFAAIAGTESIFPSHANKQVPVDKLENRPTDSVPASALRFIQCFVRLLQQHAELGHFPARKSRQLKTCRHAHVVTNKRKRKRRKLFVATEVMFWLVCSDGSSFGLS
jgi:hypothetical protein